MISTIYNVITRYRTDTRGAKADVDRLATSTDRLEKEAKGATGAFATLGATIKTALVGAATVGFGLLTRHVAGLHSQLENAEVQIASVFSVNKIHDFGVGLKRAEGVMKRFRKAAIASPGESRDFLTIFSATAPALFSSGNKSDDLIEQFTGRGLAAAFTLGGGDIQTTGQQLAQILMGQGGADNRIYQSLRKQLGEALGIDEVGSAFTEAFNKVAASEPERIFDALNKSLASLDDANAEFGQTFTGLWGSMKETANAFLVSATGPLFEQMKVSFRDLLGLATDNDEQLDALASTVGEKLASGFRMLGEAIGFARDNLTGLIVSASILGAVKLGSAVKASAAGGVLAKAGGMLRQGAAVRRTVGAGIGGGLARGGSFAADLAGELLFGGMFESATGNRGTSTAARMRGGVVDAKGRAGRGLAAQIAGNGINFGTLGKGGALGFGGKAAAAAKGGLGAMAGGGLGMAKGLIVGLASGIGTLATVLLPAIVIVGMIAGAFLVLQDTGNEATQFLMSSFDELMISLNALAGQFGFSGSGGFGSMLKSFAMWLGTGVVGVLGIAVKAIDLLVSAFGTLVETIKGIAYGIGNVFSGFSSGEITSFEGVKTAFTAGFTQAQEEAFAALRKAYEPEAIRVSDRELEGRSQTGRYSKARQEMRENDERKTEINVTNTVNVETDADPDRIAFATADLTVQSIRRLRRSVQGLPGFE